MEILGFDIGQALTPDVPLFETFLRGLVMYLVIFALLRYVLRGKTSASAADLLVLVLIADAAQNAMSAEYKSLPNGIVLVGTIIGASFTLDWLGRRVPIIERFVHRERQALIINGRIDHKALKREMISEDELQTQLNLQGIESASDVKRAYLEGTGEVSVIKKPGGDEGDNKKSFGPRP